MKKYFILFLVIAAVTFTFISCETDTDNYSATMLVKTSGLDHCEASFASLKGTLVLNATVPADTDGTIHYDAELAKGDITVYYDIDGTKNLLFSIKGGEESDGHAGTVQKGDKVTVIIETNGKAENGDIEIEFD